MSKSKFKPAINTKKSYNTKTLQRKATAPLKKVAPPEIDFKLIGQRVRAARKHMDITQEYLSELVDITPAFVGHIERGERSVSLVTILRIAMILNVSTDYLFSMEDATEDEEVTNTIIQMLNHRPLETKVAIRDIVSVALKHLD
jgi:transcriptional regulator with XRE-family HTH domain